MNYDLKKLESLSQQLKVMLKEDKEVLAEKSDHNPFSHKKNLGTGPRGKHHHEADKWDCDDCGREGGNTYCNCKGIGDNAGHEKKVTIDTAYKHDYNKQYKKGKYPKWRERRNMRKGKKKED